jgi:pyrroloquinoline quinone biosynthesis protein A
MLHLTRYRSGGMHRSDAVADVAITRMEDINMQWTTPSFTDMRFGFEITLYIAYR